MNITQATEIFFSRMVNRQDVYYLTVPPKTHQFCLRQELDFKALQKHFAGHHTLSCPVSNRQNFCKWFAWDSDNDRGALEQVEGLLLELGHKPLREAQRFDYEKLIEREGHLWMFLSEPVEASKLRAFDREIRRRLQIADGQLEFFPKQDRIADVGSALRMPLGINFKTSARGERGWFSGVEKDLEKQLLWFAVQPLNPGAKLAEIGSRLLAWEEQQRADRARKKTWNIPKSSNRQDSTRIPILELVDARRAGNEYIAQCPLCALEGHDQHRDNLHISLDGAKFCCWYGGAAASIHTGKEIIRALTGNRQAS